MNNYIPLGPILTALGIMLSVSVVVERFLAVFSWLIDRLNLLKEAQRDDIVTEQETQLALVQKAAQETEILNTPPSQNTPSPPEEIEVNPSFSGATNPYATFEIHFYQITDTNKVVKEFWLQLLGFLVASAGCYYMKFSMWQLFSWLPTVQIGNPKLWEYFLTGVVIGAGSKPIHFLMNFLINRKIEVGREEVRATLPRKEEKAETPEAAPTVEKPPAILKAPPTPSRWQKLFGFEYDGGYRPERLEYTHLRTKPIDLIVFHHTAMHSDSPYEAIIHEFEKRGWLTGYHCVVFKDGTVRTICRWDRIGNHVKGYNSHSLGIALHGNFEPDPSVPFSNPDGRLGIMFPTDQQLESAARVVALWCLLYQIPVDFQKSVLPHRKLAAKACPGSNFPYQAFQLRVEELVKQWKSNPDYQQAITELKHHPMILA